MNSFQSFSHPWETVATAAWRKYPNPHNTAVIGTDVVERSVVDGVLHSHRLVSSKWVVPKWAQAVSIPI
jgi:PRELI-like family